MKRIEFTRGDSFWNSNHSLVFIDKVDKDSILLSSEEWTSTYWNDIEKVSNHINRGFYKVNKIASMVGTNSFYILRRTGTFTVPLGDGTSNQCFKEYHPLYNYEAIVAVYNNLDEKGFIVDHEVIHGTVTQYNIKGSCEEMHQIMHREILQLPELRDKVLALKTIIKPAGVSYDAYIEKIWYNESSDIDINIILSQI